mgnify:CR=1 FL=1
MTLNRRTFYISLICMEAVIVAIALIINFFAKLSIHTALLKPVHGLWLGFALMCGLLGGILPSFVSKMPLLTNTYNKIVDSITGGFRLTLIDCIIISFIAGVSEELLFRGALQPLAGIWITSAIFVIVHGYFDPRDWKKTLLTGPTTFLMCIVAGYLYLSLGLLYSMLFHFAYDLSAYILILKRQRRMSGRDMMV